MSTTTIKHITSHRSFFNRPVAPSTSHRAPENKSFYHLPGEVSWGQYTGGAIVAGAIGKLVANILNRDSFDSRFGGLLFPTLTAFCGAAIMGTSSGPGTSAFEVDLFSTASNDMLGRLRVMDDAANFTIGIVKSIADNLSSVVEIKQKLIRRVESEQKARFLKANKLPANLNLENPDEIASALQKSNANTAIAVNNFIRNTDARRAEIGKLLLTPQQETFAIEQQQVAALLNNSFAAINESVEPLGLSISYRYDNASGLPSVVISTTTEYKSGGRPGTLFRPALKLLASPDQFYGAMREISNKLEAMHIDETASTEEQNAALSRDVIQIFKETFTQMTGNTALSIIEKETDTGVIAEKPVSGLTVEDLLPKAQRASWRNWAGGNAFVQAGGVAGLFRMLASPFNSAPNNDDLLAELDASNKDNRANRETVGAPADTDEEAKQEARLGQHLRGMGFRMGQYLDETPKTDSVDRQVFKALLALKRRTAKAGKVARIWDKLGAQIYEHTSPEARLIVRDVISAENGPSTIEEAFKQRIECEGIPGGNNHLDMGLFKEVALQKREDEALTLDDYLDILGIIESNFTDVLSRDQRQHCQHYFVSEMFANVIDDGDTERSEIREHIKNFKKQFGELAPYAQDFIGTLLLQRYREPLVEAVGKSSETQLSFLKSFDKTFGNLPSKTKVSLREWVLKCYSASIESGQAAAIDTYEKMALNLDEVLDGMDIETRTTVAGYAYRRLVILESGGEDAIAENDRNDQRALEKIPLNDKKARDAFVWENTRIENRVMTRLAATRRELNSAADNSVQSTEPARKTI